MSTQVVKLGNLGKALSGIISNLAKHSARVVAGVATEMPIRFEAAAKSHYDSVLGRVSGDLFRSIEGFSRQEGYNWLAGLRDKMAYARYLEEGTRHIKARYFLRDPLRKSASGIIKRLLKRISWEGGIG